MQLWILWWLARVGVLSQSAFERRVQHNAQYWSDNAAALPYYDWDRIVTGINLLQVFTLAGSQRSFLHAYCGVVSFFC